MASISSMKMIVGAFSLASAKASRTIFGPSPMYICTRLEPASLRKVALVCAAQARAIIVLPVPGGPNIRQPLGGRMPMSMNFSLWVMGSTMASLSSSICLSSPPMSMYCSVGRSSTSIDRTFESYSAGSFSKTIQESLFTPTNSPGFTSEESTNPATGRKTVFLVLVRTTMHLSSGFSSVSTLPMSSFSGAMSNISTMFDTNHGNCLFCFIFVRLSFRVSSVFRNSYAILFYSTLNCFMFDSNTRILFFISSSVKSRNCQAMAFRF